MSKRSEPKCAPRLRDAGWRYDELAGEECGWIPEHPTRGGVCDRIARWTDGSTHLCATHALRAQAYRSSRQWTRRR